MVQPTLTQPILANLKQLAYGGAEAIVDNTLSNQVVKITEKSAQGLYDPDIHNKFVDYYRTWISSTQVNTVVGLEQFPVAAVSQGTTESFDKFYMTHHNRRFRCFRGEYMYHAASWKSYFNWSYMEDDALRENDALVVSQPFSNSGKTHPKLYQTLDQAYKLGVPVLIDSAFFGLTGGIHFDFEHPAIHTVTFSLSKTFPVAYLRIGVRFTRWDDDDALLVNNKAAYLNRLSCLVGLELMQIYSPDYNYNTYRDIQVELCNKLRIVPSHTVIFGLDLNNRFPEYNRNGYENRLCLAKYLKTGRLPGG